VSKDPSIYDSSRQFFTRDQQEITVKKKKTPKEEAVTLRDFERKMILEKEKSDHREINTPSEMSTMTYREEQEMIKRFQRCAARFRFRNRRSSYRPTENFSATGKGRK